MVSTSTVPYYDGVADYMKLGYIPLNRSGTAASSTLEYAYDDWTIYQTALNAGNKELAETYRKRALNYRNIYDTSIGFARPRYSDGTFKKEFDVLQTYGEGFIEGNSWNFSFHVPHDVFGMMDLMGGERHSCRSWTNSSPCICRRSTMSIMRILRKNVWSADMCMVMNRATMFLIYMRGLPSRGNHSTGCVRF